MRRRLSAVVPYVVVLALACGAPVARGESTSDEEVIKTQREAIEAAKAEIVGLQAELKRRDHRIDKLEQAAGLTPLVPEKLVRASPELKMELGLLGLVNLIDRHGSTPRKMKPQKAHPEARTFVVSFWATWCKPCTSDDELRRLEQLKAALPSRQAALLSVAIDGLDKVRGDARAPSWVYPLFQGDDAHLDLLPRAFIEKFGVGLPMFFVVTASGEVKWHRQGPLDEDVIAELLAAVSVRP